jgi:hypothetical protein
MLTSFDDYPVHQTPLPVAHPGSGDRNHYDRYFFNGYDRGGEFFFGVAMGRYPNRGVVDAAFSIVQDGRQRSVFASAPAPLDPAETRVGPISIEVVEPLSVNRVRVDAAHLGIEADLTYEARSVAVEEPSQRLLDGHRLVMDVTRLTQLGGWRGAIDVGGTRRTVEAATTFGTKDRSWGVRPVGEPLPGAPGAGLGAGGGLFFLWTPLHLAGEGLFLAMFERTDGHRWYQHGGRAPVLAPGAPTFGDVPPLRELRAARYELEYRKGTRRSRAASITYSFDDGSDETVAFEPMIDFQMKGIGYMHPRWSHGRYHGPGPVEGADEWLLDDLDPLAIENVHVEQACRLTAGGRTGVGVLEQLIIGPHEPTGLHDLLDGGA